MSTQTRTAVINDYYWHLRDSSDGEGMLIINGVKVLYLNPSAYEYVRMFFNSGLSHPKVIMKMAFKYGVSPLRVKKDWSELYTSLIQTSQGCCLGDRIRFREEEKPLMAPLRIDLALTYKCNNDCTHCYVGGSKETKELSTQQWLGIIHKICEFGVPQVIFTGGESLLRDDLEELIDHAKSQGLITGLITNGRLLTKSRVDSLAMAGLDYVQITIESIDPSIHNSMVGCDALNETLAGLHNAMESSFKVTTNTTMAYMNINSIIPTVKYLIEVGVDNIGVNGIIKANRGLTHDAVDLGIAKDILIKVRDLSYESEIPFTWFTPTCYNNLDPLSLDLGVKRCSAASIVLAIEPFGRVIPCQSYFKEGLGDAIDDSFEEMWSKPLAMELREGKWVSDDCKSCRHFSFCGGGCPLE